MDHFLPPLIVDKEINIIRQENKLLRSLIESTCEPAVFIVDPNQDFRFILVNDAFCRHLNVKRHYIYQKTPADIDTYYGINELRALLIYLEKHKTKTFESEHLLPDGRKIPVEVITNYFEYENKKLIVGYFFDISSRKQNEKRRCNARTQKELQKIERQYKTVFDQLDDQIYLLKMLPDQRLKIIDINRAALSWLDRQECDCIDTYFEDYLSEAQLACHQTHKEMCLSRGQSCHYEESITSTKQYFETSLTPLKNEAGQIHRFVVIRRDITEKKTQEAEKLRRDQEFRVLVENSWDAIVRYDSQCRRIYANPAFLKIVGAPSVDAIRGKTPLNNPLSGADSTTLFYQLKHVIETKQSQKLDIIWAENGTEYCYESHFIPEFSPENELISILCIGRDYSRRRQVELALKKREEEFRTLVENSPDTISRHALDGRRTYINPQSAKIAGTLPCVMLNTSPLEYPGGPEGRRYQNYIMTVIQTGENTEFEFNWNDQSSQRCTLISLVPEKDINGQIISVLAIGRDITLLKQFRQELEQSRTQLRELIAHRERTRENQRKHIAREVHDELGQQLTALKMEIQTLDVRYTQSVPELKTHLNRIHQQLQKTISFTRNLVSRLRPCILDMGFIAALEWLVDDFESRASCVCHLHLNCHLIHLTEDVEIAVFRIVQESLTNVIKHAQASRVDIILEQFEDYLLLKIQDNGRGFDTQRHYRESFGLVGIKERVIMIHAEFNIRSVIGQGTCIELKIPTEPKRYE